MHWDLIRYHGIRHAGLAGGAFVGLAYAASHVAGIRFGLVALLIGGLGVLLAVFTLFGSGGARRGTAIEPAAPVAPGRSDMETGNHDRAALAVFFGALGTTAWAWGSMVLLGL